jgi:hypothetical protein
MRTGSFAFVMMIAAGAAAAPGQGPSEPATVAEASAVLDLNAFPLMDGAAEPSSRSLASLTYEAKGSVKDALAHHRKALLAGKWTELEGTQETDQYAAATFRNRDYRLSLSIFPTATPDKSGLVTITLNQHGNVDTARLPIPPGSAGFYKTPVSTAYLAEGEVDAVREAVGALLGGLGWQPYGTAGDVSYYKKNAVRLSARVAAAPAQGGKTLIDYSSALMSADLPAPANAARVQFSDTPTQLSVDLPGSLDDAAAYYREALGQRGWEPTTEAPIQERFERFWIFRNPAKDLIEIRMREVDGMARLLIRQRTAAEVAEMERRQEESKSKK